MKLFFERFKNKLCYSIESIKNRYPCKLVKIKNHSDFKKPTKITYQAVTRINLRESGIQDIFNDPMIVEKFHPSDAVKLGFLSAGEILLKGNKTLDEIRQCYEKIILKMFKDLDVAQ